MNEMKLYARLTEGIFSFECTASDKFDPSKVWAESSLIFANQPPKTVGLLALNQNFLQVIRWLEHLEAAADMGSLDIRCAFQDAFTDQRASPNPAKILQGLDHVDEETKWCIRFFFYKGLYYFLKQDNRYGRYQAYLLYLFACWQWYHHVKAHLQEDTHLLEDFGWVNEMALAYRELVKVLDLEEIEIHDSIFHLITAVSPKSKDLKYRLRMQMVMRQSSSRENVTRVGLPPQTPFWPKELFETNIPWDQKNREENYQIDLHPVFSKPNSAQKQRGTALSAVRQLASEIALHNYDFETALRLAHLLRGRRVNLRDKPIWLALLVFTAVFLAAGVWAGTLTGLQVGGVQAPVPELWLGYGLNWGAILLIAGVLKHFFDSRLLPRLLLPRLIGGVIVGFTVLISQRDMMDFSRALWGQNGWGVAALWLIIMAFCWFYLLQEIRPRSSDPAQQYARTWQTLVTFTFFSLIIGLALVPFPTAAFADKLSASNPDFILGPLGWVNVQLWLAFTPLALFVGMVTQFLFEDKTITASVWPVERK